MEFQCSLTNPQQPINSLYGKPHRPIPRHSIVFIYDPFYYYPSIYIYVFEVDPLYISFLPSRVKSPANRSLVIFFSIQCYAVSEEEEDKHTECP